MKKILFAILLLIIPIYSKAATLIENLEVEKSAETYKFNMSKNSWTYTLYTTKSTAKIIVEPKNGVTITGAGEVPIEEGYNKIEITATDGTNTENYTLNLNVKKMDVDENGDIINPPTGINYPIISSGVLLLIGAILLMINKNKKFYKI